MSTEVEIKLVVNPQISQPLQVLLERYVVLNHKIQPLSNTYFDTDSYQFRLFDFGLRTRKGVNFAEQTIKTAGSVQGGLHQRPEFNLPLVGDIPTLAAFPAEIWPEDADIGQLQADLVSLFTTDFERSLWQLQLANGAEIELVFDQGVVDSGDASYPICEIELELMSGDVSDLFVLAHDISQLGNVRLGNVSKAKRGYQLAGLYTPAMTRLQLDITENPAQSLADVFIQVLAQSYQHWQHHEQYYLESGDVAALVQVLEAIDLIQQTLQTYIDILPDISLNVSELSWLQGQLTGVDHALQLQQVLTNNGHFIRNFPEQRRIVSELTELQQQYVDFDQVQALMCSSRYCHIMLNISELLAQSDQLQVSVDVDKRSFSDLHLEMSWQDVLQSPLSQVDVDVDAQTYLQCRRKLQENMLRGQSFSHLYETEYRDKCRLPWQDILQGIDDLAVLQMLTTVAARQTESVALAMDKILQRKRHSLLDALEQTRHQALMMQPYWRYGN